MDRPEGGFSDVAGLQDGQVHFVGPAAEGLSVDNLGIGKSRIDRYICRSLGDSRKDAEGSEYVFYFPL